MRRLSSINWHLLAGITLAALPACPVQAGLFDTNGSKRPLPPVDLTARSESTHGVRLSVTNPYEDAHLHFEVEVTVDGARSTPPYEREISQPFKSLAPGEYRVSRIQNLAPETRVLLPDVVQAGEKRSPVGESIPVGVRGTLPYPPLAPLDLSAKLASDIAKRTENCLERAGPIRPPPHRSIRRRASDLAGPRQAMAPGRTGCRSFG